MKYQENELKQGIKLHTIKTNKFKTNLVAVFLTTELQKEKITYLITNPMFKYRTYNKYNTLIENNVNILDISQTIVDGYFNMMMVTDVTNAEFDKVATGLKTVGEEIGVIIRCQREDIFDKMHRI